MKLSPTTNQNKRRCRSVRIFRVTDGFQVEVTEKKNGIVIPFNFHTRAQAHAFVNRNLHLIGAYRAR
jgi:hypothetical protein